jgi:hypothetical protein
VQESSRLRLRSLVASLLVTMVLLTIGCARHKDPTKGVYLLIGTSGAGTAELNKARFIVNSLLGNLASGDTLAVTRIDTGRVGMKNITAKATFDQRPSVMSAQKRLFQKQIAGVVTSATAGGQTDICGGLLQAVQYLNQVETGKKYILIFSDLNEEPAKEPVKDVPFHLEGFHVIALDVSKQDDAIRDFEHYRQQMNHWQTRTESGGGIWQVINDLKRLNNLLAL